MLYQAYDTSTPFEDTKDTNIRIFDEISKIVLTMTIPYVCSNPFRALSPLSAVETPAQIAAPHANLDPGGRLHRLNA